jgi:uncharacterized protein (DUF1330 family)
LPTNPPDRTARLEFKKTFDIIPQNHLIIINHKIERLLRPRKEIQMPKGYWIARVDIIDPERYKAYIAANAQPLKKYGARFLVRAGRFENPEGATRSRNVVIEFPSYQAALDCYKSPEYQEAIKLRQPVSTGDFVIIEGYEGPQPS